nr:GNAT family N-acetyltransferase [Vibrio sinus]
MTLIEAQDWPLFLQLKTDPLVAKWCWDIPTNEQVREQFESRFNPPTENGEHWFTYVVREKQSEQAVGITGFKLSGQIAQVGYLFLPNFMGRGYATESLGSVIDWGKKHHQIDAFSAIVTAGNIASERVLEKCGFTLSEVIPDAYEIGHNKYDDHIFSLNL